MDSIEKVRRLPTQQEGPKGLENFLVSGTIIVSPVTGTIPSVCTTESGHAVPSHASPKAGHPEKPVRDPEKKNRRKKIHTVRGGGRGKNYGSTRRHRTWETTMKLGSLLMKGGGGMKKIPIHRVQDLEVEWLNLHVGGSATSHTACSRGPSPLKQTRITILSEENLFN